MAPGLRDPVVASGALRVAECHLKSGWLGVNWSTLSARVSSGRFAVGSWSRTSAPATVLAQDRSAVMCPLSHTGPPRWCTSRCPASSSWSSSVCTAMCGFCGTAVATSWLVLRVSTGGLGWPPQTCTITHSVRSCACSVAWAHWPSLVISHTGVGAWGRERRDSCHATSALGAWCSPSVSPSVAEDVQEGCRWVVCRPLQGGG